MKRQPQTQAKSQADQDKQRAHKGKQQADQDKQQTDKDEQQANNAADSLVPAAILDAAAKIARTIRARAVFLYLEALDQPQQLSQIKLGKSELILVVRDRAGAKHAKSLTKRHIMVPPISLTRMGQIKTAVLIAFSQRFLAPGDSFVFLAAPVNGQIDTMVVMNVGKEWEMFQTVDQPELTEHIKRVVFQRVLALALELASEGREGKPSGALFVIGDHHNVSEYCQQNIINPFKGHDEEHRNVLDATMTETVKSFSSQAGIPTSVATRGEKSTETFSQEINDLLDANEPDLVCMAGFLSLWLIPEKYRWRVMNIHPALLPSFGGKGMYGSKVHQAVLDAGCKISGCTVHFADNKYDHGPIIIQRAVRVIQNDDPDSLARRVFQQIIYFLAEGLC